jgi:predicted nicotinamide N-methyase
MGAVVLSLVRSILFAAGIVFAGVVVARYTLERFEQVTSEAVNSAISGATTAIGAATEDVSAAVTAATRPAWVPYALAIGAVVAVAYVLEDG